MRPILPAAAGLLLCLFVQPVAAEDTEPCGANMVCASAPGTVMAAMEKAKLAPKMTTDGEGDPLIHSSESTYQFDVYFYGCNAHAKCDSLRFETVFEKAPENTFELANKWNARKRFLQAYVREDGTLAVAYDVATIGGLNQRNFADVLDWWNNQLDELNAFFKKEVPPAPAKK